MSKKTCFQDKLLFFTNKDSNETKSCKSLDIIRKHNFIYSISVLIPGAEFVPKNIISVENIQYFTVPKLKLVTLVESIFIEAFVQRGSLSILSVNKTLNTDSTFCILPTGVLILNLLNDHYECLGLEGKKSKFFKETGKHVVEVDLKNLRLGADSRKHQRLLTCLANFTEVFDAVFNWCPQDADTDHRSPQAYLLAQGYMCKEMQVMKSEFTHHGTSVPSIDLVKPSETAIQALHEWIGMTTCRCSYGDNESYENNTQPPQPNTQHEHLSVLNLSGFFPTFVVEQIFRNLKSYLESDEGTGTPPWACLSLLGFQDSPVSLSNSEHCHMYSGDNSHTLLLSSDHSIISILNLPSHALPM